MTRIPLAIAQDEVQARDLAAGIDKTFQLAYMELADAQTAAPEHDPAGPQRANNQTVQVALTPQLPELQALGWHVELGKNRVSLHRFFKNGTLRKGCDVTIGFDAFIVELFDDFDGKGLQEARRASKRPYNVSSRSFPTRIFENLLPAMALFLDEAHKLAPKT
jgi:hypothetical protein